MQFVHACHKERKLTFLKIQCLCAPSVISDSGAASDVAGHAEEKNIHVARKKKLQFFLKRSYQNSDLFRHGINCANDSVF